MFERFTDRARRAVVSARDEAGKLGHDHIGTEHVLLGLLNDNEGVAGEALVILGITLEDVRRLIEEIVGKGKLNPGGYLPFTPRANKVLELALREALSHGQNYIGTEHILLEIAREDEGMAMNLLLKLGVSSEAVRGTVERVLKCT